MRAKAKMPYRHIRAFSGHLYVNYEWRDVPDGCWDEAQRLYEQDYLELLIAKAEDEVQPVEIDATEGAVKLAETLGIDLATVSGTGQDGRVLIADVRAHAMAEEEE